MSVVTKRNTSELPRYQYKLNDNHKGADFASINGVNLSRDYKTFLKFKHDLVKFIRTYNNPEGTIDHRVLNALDSEKTVDPSEIDYDKKREIHSRKTLSTFSRKEIEDISRLWLISPIKKRSEFLVDLIVKEQTTYEEYMAEQENNVDVDEEDLILEVDLEGEFMSTVIDAKKKFYEETGQITSGQITEIKEEE